jgi:hypothetical protein
MNPANSDRPSTPDRVAVCLASDAGYAFPSAVVAESIVRMEGSRLGPVYYAWADDDAPPGELVSYLSQAGVRLVRVPEALLRPHAGASAGRLPRGCLARLFLSQTLESEAIGRFLYLDSDIEVRGSLDRLAAIPLPAGQIAAADDVRGVVFEKAHMTDQLRAERRRLGMPDSAAYFNTGVMLADMNEWAGISVEAVKFYVSDPAACIFLDQCAINAVCHDRRLVLSPRWNFQSPYFSLGLEEQVRPSILHFTGPHKPWAPVPFTPTWTARGPFFAARGRMPLLWKHTRRHALPRSYYTKALKLTYRTPASRASRRREVFDYLARMKFGDMPESSGATLPAGSGRNSIRYDPPR